MIHDVRESTAVPGRRPDLVKWFRDRAFERVAQHGPGVTFRGQPGDAIGTAPEPPADLDAGRVGVTAHRMRPAVTRGSAPLPGGVRPRVAGSLA